MSHGADNGPGRLDGVPWPRAALLLLLAWWTVPKIPPGPSWCFLNYVDLAFHEAGHLVFGFAGETITALGGTFGQLLVPASLGLYFLFRQRQPFAAAFCAWWFGENLTYVAAYMADARALALPLVGGGEHDWNWLFHRFGVLTEPAVHRISGATHVAGLVVMALGLIWATYFVLPAIARSRVRMRLVTRWPWIESALET